MIHNTPVAAAELGLSERAFANICRVLEQFPQIERAVVFGSRAKGTYKHGSDVDIALVGADVSERLALDVSGILNEREPLPYFFDVIAFDAIRNTELREHIERVGKCMYEQK
jgi:predicted nucleotidyltransferase